MHRPNVGFALNKDDSYVKCYMGDTGLLVSLAFSENELSSSRLYQQIMNDKLSLNKGMLYENMIAQMITSMGKSFIFIQSIIRKNIEMILKLISYYQMRVKQI